MHRSHYNGQPKNTHPQVHIEFSKRSSPLGRLADAFRNLGRGYINKIQKDVQSLRREDAASTAPEERRRFNLKTAASLILFPLATLELIAHWPKQAPVPEKAPTPVPAVVQKPLPAITPNPTPKVIATPKPEHKKPARRERIEDNDGPRRFAEHAQNRGADRSKG